MNIVRRLKRVTNLVNAFILLCLLVSNSGLVPKARAESEISKTQSSNDLVTELSVLDTIAFIEDFSTDPNTNGKWNTYRYAGDTNNEASWDSASQTLYLTRAIQGLGVATFANYQLTETKWETQFRYLAGGGSDADGFIFMFYKDEATYNQPGAIAGGGAIGFNFFECSPGIPGYGIEFDNFQNPGCGDPSPNYIALIKDSVANHLISVDDLRTEDNIWHNVLVQYDNGHVVVNVDGGVVLDYIIANPDYTYSGVGFSSATGGGTNNHIIDDFVLRVDGQAQPPLILVHGWQGTEAFDGNPDTNGYSCSIGNGENDIERFQRYSPTSSNSTLKSDSDGIALADWLSAEYDVWIAHLKTSSSSTPSLEFNAACLKDQINYVYSQNPQPITIVAHSMGGPVSRAAIRYLDNPNKISGLYTLGSPHAGLPTEVVAFLLGPILTCTVQRGMCDMSLSSMNGIYDPVFHTLLNNPFNKKHPNLPGSNYYFIGGDGGGNRGWSILDIMLRATYQGPNDGLVGQYSSAGWVFNQHEFSPPNWASLGNLEQYFTDETHPALDDQNKSYYVVPGQDYPDHAQGDSDSYRCIVALMNDDTPDPQYCESATSQPLAFESLTVDELPSSQTVSTEIKTGHLNAGQEIMLPIAIDSVGTTVFYLGWSGGHAPSFTLTRPDAQVIDPSYAIAHPDEVVFQTSNGSPEVTPNASYNFVSGQVGVWQAHIVANDAIDYMLFGLIDSNLLLSANTNSAVYQSGESATITANLDSGGTSLSGATVTATLTRPDNVVDVVSLTDQGNGTYTNTYTIPDTPGYLMIDVTATGSDNGTAFSRQENLLVAIAPNDLQLTGNYGDQPRDDNLDGFYDFLDFTAEVDLASPGEYAVSAELYAGDQLITQSGDFLDLSAGIQTITLPFDGGAIREAGLNGPYTVKNLYFTPIDIGITAASVENAWTTQAYSYTQFANITYTQVSFLSSSVEDGWILESSETSGMGGKQNKNATLLRVGDDAANKQYRSILSFDTSTLPEGAVITSVTLKFKHAGISGTNPFNTHGKLLADICEGAFKNNPALQLADFNAKCPAGFYKAKALIYSNTKVDNWYSQSLLPDNFQFINLEGVTQFRLRFAKDDNNDFGADFLKLFSGNAAIEADRPQLVIEYYVP